MIRVAVAAIFLSFHVLGQQPPPLPEEQQQQPMVIRQTNYHTNVTISITTIITEVQGVKIDHQFIPLRTNLMFRTVTNIWSTP